MYSGASAEQWLFGHAFDAARRFRAAGGRHPDAANTRPARARRAPVILRKSAWIGRRRRYSATRRRRKNCAGLQKRQGVACGGTNPGHRPPLAHRHEETLAAIWVNDWGLRPSFCARRTSAVWTIKGQLNLSYMNGILTRWHEQESPHRNRRRRRNSARRRRASRKRPRRAPITSRNLSAPAHLIILTGSDGSGYSREVYQAAAAALAEQKARAEQTAETHRTELYSAFHARSRSSGNSLQRRSRPPARCCMARTRRRN